ncbi:MAG: alpha-1,4-glucan--maltose-1-phosphate maltosyltransferase, partial [Candidatus Nanopelagicales bacterium]
KYQYRPRDWAAAEAEGRSLAPYLKLLNRIRREHPALQTLRGISFHETSSDSVIAYSRREGDDVILTICSLNPHGTAPATVKLNMPALGLGWDAQFTAHDLVSNNSWTWGREVYVELDPFKAVAHIVSVRSA